VQLCAKCAVLNGLCSCKRKYTESQYGNVEMRILKSLFFRSRTRTRGTRLYYTPVLQSSQTCRPTASCILNLRTFPWPKCVCQDLHPSIF